jgi:hypothetical protein
MFSSIRTRFEPGSEIDRSFGHRATKKGPSPKKGPPTSGGPGVGLNPIHFSFLPWLIVSNQYIDRYRGNAIARAYTSDRHASGYLREIHCVLAYRC